MSDIDMKTKALRNNIVVRDMCMYISIAFWSFILNTVIDLLIGEEFGIISIVGWVIGIGLLGFLFCIRWIIIIIKYFLAHKK